MKYSWMSPITLSENSVEKMQVFCPWSSFRMSACTVPRTADERLRLDRSQLLLGRARARVLRNFSTCWSIAVLKNIARIVGAGPLMVIDTEVVGSHRSKPEYSTFMSSSVAIDTPELPTLP